MKNQYVADINDYRKYGLLRVLSQGGRIKIGVCWMLTTNDSRTDGKFINYLQFPNRWKHHDPELFTLLSDCIQNNERNVEYIDKTVVLKNSCYHSETLPDNPNGRIKYLNNMNERFQDTDLIFFDPDNGFEITSRPYGRKNSSKYLFWEELKAVFDSGKSALIYQHFTRVPRDKFISDLAEKMMNLLVTSEVYSFRTPHVVFLLAVHPKHSAQFKESIPLVSECWNGQIKCDSHCR